MTDHLAIPDADPVPRLFGALRRVPGTIDHDPQHPPDGLAPELQIKDLQPVTLSHAAGRIAHTFQGLLAVRRHVVTLSPEKRGPEIEKVGTGPLTTAFPLRAPRSIHRTRVRRGQGDAGITA